MAVIDSNMADNMAVIESKKNENSIILKRKKWERQRLNYIRFIKRIRHIS